MIQSRGSNFISDWNLIEIWTELFSRQNFEMNVVWYLRRRTLDYPTAPSKLHTVGNGDLRKPLSDVRACGSVRFRMVSTFSCELCLLRNASSIMGASVVTFGTYIVFRRSHLPCIDLRFPRLLWITASNQIACLPTVEGIVSPGSKWRRKKKKNNRERWIE